MNWWSRAIIDVGLYQKMKESHKILWTYISGFIARQNIFSILEVGGGLVSDFKHASPVYQAIDINERTDAIHEDFTLMDVSWIKGFDLLLACAVIEHCDGYENFIKQAIATKSKYIIITFFNGLNRKENFPSTQTKYGSTYIWNKYSLNKLTDFMNTLGVRFEIERLGKRDSVLIIYDS